MNFRQPKVNDGTVRYKKVLIIQQKYQCLREQKYVYYKIWYIINPKTKDVWRNAKRVPTKVVIRH